jgi:hypothetical protein
VLLTVRDCRRAIVVLMWVRARTATSISKPLVHVASLIAVASKHEFQFIEATNFLDFYEDHKRNHHAALKKCGVLANKKQTLEQTDIIGNVLCVFVFALVLSFDDLRAC